jgi:hypothetical protein
MALKVLLAEQFFLHTLAIRSLHSSIELVFNIFN